MQLLFSLRPLCLSQVFFPNSVPKKIQTGVTLVTSQRDVVGVFFKQHFVTRITSPLTFLARRL